MADETRVLSVGDENKVFRYMVYFMAFVLVSVVCSNHSQDIATTVCEKTLPARVLEFPEAYLHGLLSCNYGYAFQQSEGALDFTWQLLKVAFNIILTEDGGKSDELYMCQLDWGVLMQFQFSVEANYCKVLVEEGEEMLSTWLALTGCILLVSFMAELHIWNEFRALDDNIDVNGEQFKHLLKESQQYDDVVDDMEVDAKSDEV